MRHSLESRYWVRPCVEGEALSRHEVRLGERSEGEALGDYVTPYGGLLGGSGGFAPRDNF